MAWSVLQSIGAFSGTNPLNVQPASNLTAGSKVLLFVNMTTSNAGVTWTVNDGNGNSFGQVYQAAPFVLSTHYNYMGIWALDTPAGDVGTRPTCAITPSAGSGFELLLLEVSGLQVGQTSAILDGTPGIATWSTAATATDPAYSSTAAAELLVQFLGDNTDSLASGAYTPPTGYAGSVEADNTSSGSGGVAWKNSTGGSEAGADWTFTSSTSASIVKVAFYLAGGAATPIPDLAMAPMRGY